MTSHDAVDRWLAETEWAEIGGDGGDAMRCRPRGDVLEDQAPWIGSMGPTRVRIFDAIMVDFTGSHGSGSAVSPREAMGARSEPSCPVHGPALAGICWRCTERLGSRFTGVAMVSPDTGLLRFDGAESATQSTPPVDPYL